MIVVLSLFISGLATVLLIANFLERAPEAFEDENGFHILGQESNVPAPAVSSITHASELAS